jgi:hypothetical protein
MTKSLSQNLLFEKKYWVVRHLLFWSFIYLDEVLNLFGITDTGDVNSLLLINILIDFALVYINIYVLIPKFLNKGKYFIYGLLTFIKLCLVVWLIDYMDTLYYPMTPEEMAEIDYVGTYIHGGITQLGVLFPAVAITMVKNNWSNTEKLNALNQFQYEAQLDKLKKQINPHFLFNSLNAIYIQAKQKDESVPESIMALSDLMRYQTYDALQNETALSKEIDFIKTYLEMEKMRRDRFEYSIVHDSDHIKNVLIEPLLLLPLVENACKYNTSLNSKDLTYVNIAFKIEGKELRIDVFNNIGHIPQEKNDKYSGLGQSNIKKRLELLYPSKHEFKIVGSKNEYHVMLKLSPLKSTND